MGKYRSSQKGGRYRKTEDLTTSEGLSRLAASRGGAIAEKAKEIIGEEPSLISKVGSTLKTGLKKTLDILQRPNYAIATSVKNVLDEDPTTTALGGLKTGITGETKHTFTDVFEEAGWKPESVLGKASKGLAGFATDVLLDPTTYITFGASAGVKVGTKTLSKAGTELLAKGVAQKSGQAFGIDFVKNSILKLSEGSPELYKKFIDQGGIKFFGNTIISGGRIAKLAESIPGMSKFDEVTAPLRNNLYALFNRDGSAKFGNLNKIAGGREFLEMQTKFRDLGITGGPEAIDLAVNVAKANNLTYQEIQLINNAIETKLPLAPTRLENARRQISNAFGKILKEEQKAGIAIGELPNYVPHMLVDEPVLNIPFKPEGVRVSLGAAKGRTIGKIDSQAISKGISKEEWIKGQGTPMFRSSASPFDVKKMGSDGVFVSPDKPFVERWQKAQGYKNFEEFVISPDAKILKRVDFPKEFVRNEGGLNFTSLDDQAKIIAYAKKNGFDGIEDYSIRDGKKIDHEFAIWNKDKIKTPSQLSSLYDEAVKGTKIIGKGKPEDITQATIKEINEAFGKNFFDDNVINTLAIRGVASKRAIAATEFLRETATKFGVAAEHAPTGYIEAGVKELTGFKFHPAIVEQINGFKKSFINDNATNNLLNAFDKVQNLWKASVTSLFPAFHGRNAISNVFLNFLDIGKGALSPAKHFLSTTLLQDNKTFNKLERVALEVGEEGIKAKKALQELSDKIILTDDFGKKWSFGELRTEIKNNRVAFGDEFTGFLDIRDTISDKLAGIEKGAKEGVIKKAQPFNPFSQQNVAFKTGRAVGNAIEQQARILNFITNLERTGDVVTSAARTKQFLFDYTNLSDFEKNVMRRLIPFYTFTRKNLELQVTQLLKQPGKFATQAKLFTSISKLVSGGTLSDKEQKNLPGFLQQGLGIIVSRDKNNLQVINAVGLPIEQIFSAIQPNAILGSMSPVIAVPLQTAIGKHFFFDRDLKDVNDAKAFQNWPQFIKDYIGYTTRKNKDGTIRHIALNPTRLFIISSLPPSSRVISTIGQLEDENVSGKLKILRQLTGLKPYGADLDKQAKYNEKKKIRDLQDLLDETGVAPIFRRSFIPKK